MQISDTWSDKQKPEKQLPDIFRTWKMNFKKSHFSNFEQSFLTSDKEKQSMHGEQHAFFKEKNASRKYFWQNHKK